MMDPYGVKPLIGTAIALPILALVAVCLRFYVRLRMRHTYLGVDDWLVMLSVLLVCGQGITQILSVEIGGGGIYIDPNDKRRIANQQKLSHAIIIIEKVTYTTIKLSVLFLYRRIFAANATFRKVNDILIALIVLWGLAFLFSDSFMCISGSKSTMSCVGQEWVLLWFAITEVLGDIAVLSLPYPCIRKLQMGKKDKIGLTAIFALGTLSTVFGIIRLGYVARTFYAFFHPQVENGTGAAPGFWTTMQVSIGVIAACLPPLGPLVRKVPGPKKLYSSIRQGSSIGSRSNREVYGMEKLKDSGFSAETRQSAKLVKNKNAARETGVWFGQSVAIQNQRERKTDKYYKN